jgi:hypothetical protein
MKLGEAEPLLLQGCQALEVQANSVPIWGRSHVTDAIVRVVEFYDATGQSEKAAEWRQKLEHRRAAFEDSSTGK